MDIKKLTTAVTVAQCGSITKAAEVLNYTQSGVTHIIHALEKEMGLQLFIRSHEGVALTEAAQRLMPRINGIIDAQNLFQAELAVAKQLAVSSIHIGAYASMAQHWFPDITDRFSAEHPTLDITLRTGNFAEICDLLDANLLDCAFVSFQQNPLPDRFEWIPLHRDELVAVLPESYFIENALFNIESFSRYEFLMPANHLDFDRMAFWASNNIQPSLRYINMDSMTVLAMVQHGKGWSILPELVTENCHNGIKTYSLTPPVYRELGIILRKDSQKSSLLSQFAELSRCEVSKHYQK